MEKIKAALNALLERIRSVGLRRPSSRFTVLALSGKAVMVWTDGGNIVVTQETARMISQRLDQFADITEK